MMAEEQVNGMEAEVKMETEDEAGDKPAVKMSKLYDDTDEVTDAKNYSGDENSSEKPEDNKENNAQEENNSGIKEEPSSPPPKPEVETQPSLVSYDVKDDPSKTKWEDDNSSDQKPHEFQKPVAPPSLLTMKELPMPPSLLSLDVADPVCLMQMDQTGKCYEGPGAKRDIKPFAPPRLSSAQKEDISRAKKYAAEQSIKNVLGKAATATVANQQMQQFQNDIKRQQALALMCRVYCGSISVNFDVNDDILKKAFAPFGPLKAVKLSFDPLTQNHKGFAFIEYDLPEAAELAIAQMNGYFMGGRNLRVTRPSNVPQAQPMIETLAAEARAYNRIYVTSIHTDLNENDIKSVFGAFGRINKCDLEPDPLKPGKHRGFGFIEFATLQSAMDAVTSMNMFDLGGQLLRVCMAQTPPGAMTPPVAPLPTASAVAAAAINAKLQIMEKTSAHQASGIPPPGLALPGSGLPTANPSPAVPQHLASSVNSTGLKLLQMANGPGPSSIPLIQPTNVNLNQGLAGTLNQLSASASTGGLGDMQPSASQLSSLPGMNGSSSQIKQESTEPKIDPDDPNRVMVLRNMVGPEDLDDDLEAEVTEECGKFGQVKRVIIYQEKQSEEDDAEVIVKIFVEFASPIAMQKGCQSLNNRFFGGRIVTAEKYSQDLYDSNDLTE